VPTVGDVTIESNMNVILDVSPPKLRKLTIAGGLRFDNSSAAVNLTLEVDSIVVFGNLEIGSAQKPFLGNATIMLYGIRSSPTVVVDNAYFLGNKLIAVFGNVTMYGKSRNTTWTRLGGTARAGWSNVTLSRAVDWSAGDEIVISATEYDASQAETAVIKSVSNIGGRSVLTLNRVLAFDHSCNEVAVAGWNGNGGAAFGSGGGNGSISLCGVVGLLNRNVKIVGANINASTVNYGGSMVVGDLVRPPAFGGGLVIGRVELNHVQVHNFGKMATEHAAILFSYQFSSNPVNTVTGCSFSYGLNYAVVVKNTRNLNLTGNVFHNTFRNAIDLDAKVR
jgi:cell surface hyaluronidase